MSGKGKRRSARLLKLEEQRNDDDSTAVCLLDPWQIIRNSIAGSSARGKRKRHDEHQSQGEASCSHQQPSPAAANSNSLPPSHASVGQIIECILDELEMRDRHELFAMPDDIQVTDYAERVNRPGDFATLRQKNKDGMYTALEQFENDVYMVFQKAMTMNSQDTVPFKEAMSLLNQAKHVFMSLKNNQMYSESELAAWRQRHLDQVQQPITPARTTEAGTGVPSSRAATTPAPGNTGIARKKGARAAEKKMQENAKNVGSAPVENQRARQRGGKEAKVTPPPGKKMRKDGGDAGVSGRRRLTYTDEPGSDQARRAPAMPMPALQGRHVTLQDHPQEHTYRESLQRFVRHAGLKARVAAEFRSLECVARARHSPVAQYWNPGAGFLPHGYHYLTQRPPPGAIDPALRALPPSSAEQAAAPTCKLETDELLKLFVLMGTPGAFLERAKQMSGDDNKRKEGAKKRVSKAKAADDVPAGAKVAEAAGHARTGATAAKAMATTRPRPSAAKAANQARADGTAAKAMDTTRGSPSAVKAANRARAGATATRAGPTAAKAADHARAGATAAKAMDTTRPGLSAAKVADHARAGATAAKAMDTTRPGPSAAKAADHARAGATAPKARASSTASKESGQKSSASEAAAGAYGPFAPPRLLPGRLGFGQFASSSSQPFKVKPSTSNASGDKKIS